MKKYSILIVIVVIFGWTIFDFVQSDDMEESELDELESEEDGWMVSSESVQENPDESTVGLNVGSMAPDFELKNLEGETVKLSDYRGQKVMLNFWATWCPPCRAEMPDMQKFYEEKDVVILGVDLFDTETSLNEIEEFTNKHELNFPILLDEKGNVSSKYQILSVPTSYFIDRRGIIRHKSLGAMNYEMMVKEYEKMN